MRAAILIILMNAFYSSYPPEAKAQTIQSLTPPATTGGMSLAQALSKRRSVRSYREVPLEETEISQLLWSAQGVTDRRGHRTAPSAGAKYPLEIYLVMESGTYHYLPDGHRLELLDSTDLRNNMEDASLEQEAVGDAPAVFVVAANYGKTEVKYGSRAERYVKIEAGHACQNILLQATALGLGGVSIGAFTDDMVEDLLDLPMTEEALYVVPIGHPN